MSLPGSSIIGVGAIVVRSVDLLILLVPAGLRKLKLSDVSSKFDLLFHDEDNIGIVVRDLESSVHSVSKRYFPCELASILLIFAIYSRDFLASLYFL